MARRAVVSGGGTGWPMAQIPMGRAGTPDQIAAAVGYLAASDAGWTTGQILQVNGGTLLGRG